LSDGAACPAVLVIDDNDTNVHVLTGLLSAQGMSVSAARGGADALRLAAQHGGPFALIVVDAILADADGAELVTALRALPSCADAAALVMTTTLRRQDDRGRLPDASYIVKPVGHHSLIKALRETLGSRPGADRTPVAPPLHRSAQPPVRVLIADDNIVNQKLIRHLLEERGHAVAVVSNGRQAVEEVSRGDYDLVLMDLQMPEMDGLEATAVIRARERLTHLRVPIVALTAHAMAGDRQRCLDAQMDDYLAKPIKAGELFDVLDRVLVAAAS
jgi:two-component system, sensor histidine kinase and response regulator